jgi:uncharacterized membrane protein YvbJ
MYCPRCGREIAENSNACMYCGADVSILQSAGFLWNNLLRRIKLGRWILLHNKQVD